MNTHEHERKTNTIYRIRQDTSYTSELGLQPESDDLEFEHTRADARWTMGLHAERLQREGLHLRRKHLDSMYLSDGETFVWLRIVEQEDTA